MDEARPTASSAATSLKVVARICSTIVHFFFLLENKGNGVKKGKRKKKIKETEIEAYARKFEEINRTLGISTPLLLLQCTVAADLTRCTPLSTPTFCFWA